MCLFSTVVTTACPQRSGPRQAEVLSADEGGDMCPGASAVIRGGALDGTRGELVPAESGARLQARDTRRRRMYCLDTS